MGVVYRYLVIYNYISNGVRGRGRAIAEIDDEVEELQDLDAIRDVLLHQTGFSSIDIESLQFISYGEDDDMEESRNGKTYH